MMMGLRVKSLMENLDELAGLDIVRMREAGYDPRPDRNPESRAPSSGWRHALLGLIARRPPGRNEPASERPDADPR